MSDLSVWRQLDPVELERQYNARGTVDDIEVFLSAYRDASTPLYTQLPCLRDLRYGPHPEERLDLFPVPGNAAAPLFVFVHGGYWRTLSKEDSVFMARNFTQRGIAVAAVNYALAPQTGLAEIVAQCRRALGWLYGHGTAYGIDVKRVVVAGSSAGAHLAAMLLAQDWQASFGVPPDIVKAAVLVSGLYDLEPVQQTRPNQWLRLDDAQARDLSPVHALPAPGTRLCIATAEADTDEFKRQSLLYAAACRAQGCTVHYFEVPGRNHFNVIMDWMDASAPLTRSSWSLFEPIGGLS